MLNVVPIGINKAARLLVLNHPNSVHCKFLRKHITRPSDGTSMGLPTLGGMGVLSMEDEEDYTVEELGNAYALRADSFSPSQMMDQQDANNGTDDSFVFLIEPELLPPDQWSFTIKKNDIFYYVISDAPLIELGFEIVAIETVNNIPPFSQRYICNRMRHLDTV